jgi:hypothetical protein
MSLPSLISALPMRQELLSYHLKQPYSAKSYNCLFMQIIFSLITLRLSTNTVDRENYLYSFWASIRKETLCIVKRHLAQCGIHGKYLIIVSYYSDGCCHCITTPRTESIVLPWDINLFENAGCHQNLILLPRNTVCRHKVGKGSLNLSRDCVENSLIHSIFIWLKARMR